jgi:hypothetical protein
MPSVTQRLTNYANPNSFGSKMRRKRASSLIAMIDCVFDEKDCVKILDLGGRVTYWNILPENYLESRKVHITIVNLPSEKETASGPHFTCVEGSACDLPQYEDRAFDIVHSNSVIEHVGTWCNMRAFASECKRLGEHYFVQTPNFWFPIEPHFMAPFVHWLPLPLHAWLLTKMSLGHYPRYDSLDMAIPAAEGARLLNERMMASLFPDARIQKERLLFLTKSLTAISSSRILGHL